uniref:Uncharacterized protein n=1 Tax=Pseudoalteromonas citrea DSM 8771 TaxID=1117314 RepID=U1J9E0_9GAMM
MSYFFLLPAYWLCGVLLYRASPRQSFTQTKSTARKLSLTCTGAVVVLTVLMLLNSQAGLATALLTPLILFMFFVPAPVFLLSHRPAWAWPSLIFVILLSFLFQLLGANHVA